MQQRFDFKPSSSPRQQVFQFQDKALAALDSQTAKSIVKVFDQAYAMRLWSTVPMLPGRPPAGWRSEKDRLSRRELQNTYQLNALCIDMSIDRHDLAKVPSFRAFERRARAAVRFFDLRIGPPWWINNKEFLESAYISAQEQEVPDTDMNDDLECYWGECADVPYWVAQSFFDNLHATESDVMSQVIWARRSHGWTNAEYRANMLLNWQVTFQPLLAYAPDTDLPYAWANTFPHQFELRRLIRLLDTKPRGRPERSLIHADNARPAAARRTSAALGNPHYQVARG